uniref:Uncharacterized protein n=1 Tax=Caenorhabditis tropicalis TaxID=1561998 RepID=A0A1I7T6G9_9PELO
MAGINMAGNLLGGLFGAKVPPPAPVPVPVPPPDPVPVPVPGEDRTVIEYRTHAPLPPQTVLPETLTYLGIIALVLMVFTVLACSASGIGFYFWHNQRAEKERRDNERGYGGYGTRMGGTTGYGTTGTIGTTGTATGGTKLKKKKKKKDKKKKRSETSVRSVKSTKESVPGELDFEGASFKYFISVAPPSSQVPAPQKVPEAPAPPAPTTQAPPTSQVPPTPQIPPPPEAPPMNPEQFDLTVPVRRWGTIPEMSALESANHATLPQGI